MTRTAGDFPAERLAAWGVRRIFGYPGDGNVASEYCHAISNPVAVRHVIDRAIRVAMTTRSVTCVTVPDHVAKPDAADADGMIAQSAKESLAGAFAGHASE